MIEPYTAIGLIPSFWGIRRREDIAKNLEHLESLTHAAFWLSNLDIPVKLIAIPEGAIQGFNDEVLDLDHAEFARACAIDIPGPETERLGKLVRHWGVFVMAQAKARHEDWPNLFFNVGFVIDPDGTVVLKHYKISALLRYERSVSPHDLFDWWVGKIRPHLAGVLAGRRYAHRAARHHDGDGGQLPRERARTRAERRGGGVPLLHAGAVHRERHFRNLQPRPRARNNFYVVAPNIGDYHLYPDSETQIDAGGGQSMIVDYKGAIVGKQRDTNGSNSLPG